MYMVKKYKIDMMGGQNKQIHVRQLFFDTDRSMAELMLWLQIPLWPLATVYHGLFVVILKTQLQSYACTSPTALLLVRILRILFHVVMIMLTTTKLDTLLFYYYVTPIKSIYIFISFNDAYGVVKSQKYI